MKRVILLFLVFAGLTFGSCRRQTVMPQFDIVVTDTVAVRGGIPCRFQYAFYLDRQCRRSSGIAGDPRESDMLSISSDWSTSRAGCRRLSIYLSGSSWTSISVPWMSRYPSGKPKWRWRSSPRPVWWIRCWSIRFRVRTIRAVRTVCTASIAIIIPLRAVMSLALSDLFDAARQEALIGLIRNKLYEQFGVTGGRRSGGAGIFSRIHFHDREFRSDRGRHYVLL